MPQPAKGRSTKLSENPVVRVAAYYVLLAAGTAIAWRVFPGLRTVFSAERLDALSQGRNVSDNPLFESLNGGNETLPPPLALAITTALCMTGAFLLMLPVTWVYILTRQKKGYRQSVVQTLVILPIVVAGVVLLVKNSLALAFSLGGIVGGGQLPEYASRHQGRGLHLPRHRRRAWPPASSDVGGRGAVVHLQRRDPRLLVHRLRTRAGPSRRPRRGEAPRAIARPGQPHRRVRLACSIGDSTLDDPGAAGGDRQRAQTAGRTARPPASPQSRSTRS